MIKILREQETHVILQEQYQIIFNKQEIVVEIFKSKKENDSFFGKIKKFFGFSENEVAKSFMLSFKDCNLKPKLLVDLNSDHIQYLDVYDNLILDLKLEKKVLSINFDIYEDLKVEKISFDLSGNFNPLIDEDDNIKIYCEPLVIVLIRPEISSKIVTFKVDNFVLDLIIQDEVIPSIDVYLDEGILLNGNNIIDFNLDEVDLNISKDIDNNVDSKIDIQKQKDIQALDIPTQNIDLNVFADPDPPVPVITWSREVHAYVENFKFVLPVEISTQLNALICTPIIKEFYQESKVVDEEVNIEVVCSGDNSDPVKKSVNSMIKKVETKITPSIYYGLALQSDEYILLDDDPSTRSECEGIFTFVKNNFIAEPFNICIAEPFNIYGGDDISPIYNPLDYYLGFDNITVTPGCKSDDNLGMKMLSDSTDSVYIPCDVSDLTCGQFYTISHDISIYEHKPIEVSGDMHRAFNIALDREIDSQEPIKHSDLSKLTSFVVTISDGSASTFDKSLLALMTNVKRIVLQKCDLENDDLKYIAHLRHLESLDISNNPNLTDVSVLKDLEKLKEFDFSKTNITDLTSVSKLTNLISIVSNLQAPSISILSNSVNVMDVTLNPITDLEPIRNLVNLSYISLCGHEISDISVLSDFTQLVDVNLDKNKIFDMSPLKEQRNLYRISLLDQTVDDEAIVAVAGDEPNEFVLNLDFFNSPINTCHIDTYLEILDISDGGKCEDLDSADSDNCTLISWSTITKDTDVEFRFEASIISDDSAEDGSVIFSGIVKTTLNVDDPPPQ